MYNLVATDDGREALKDRYWTNLQKTAAEDPIGLASDLLTLVSGGAGIASKTASLSAKVAGKAKMGKLASASTAISQKAGNIAKTAGGAADL